MAAEIEGASHGTPHVPEGTAVKSTGETGGTKFLREDGDGTSSWQSLGASAGGLVKLSTATSVSSNALTLTGMTGYKNYLITGEGLVSTDDQYSEFSGNFIKAELAVGSTYSTTGYAWRERVYTMEDDGSDDYGISAPFSSGTYWAIGPVSGDGTESSPHGGDIYSGSSFTMTLGNMSQTQTGFGFYHSEGVGLEGERSDVSSTPQVPVPCFTACHGCFRHGSSVVNAIRFKAVIGDLNAGTATLYGFSTA